MNNPSSLPERRRRLEWVPIEKMKVSPLAQRDLRPDWVSKIAANFKPEELGNPTLSQRDGAYFIIDGQHRIEALRFLGFGDTTIECWVYDDLTDEQEAAKFLDLNNRLSVAVFPKFRIGVQAGRAEETAINDIVQACGLRIALQTGEGCISAVGTLRTVYRRDGNVVLARALSIIRDAYGTPGLRAKVIDGIALFCARYDDKIDTERVIEKLGAVRGGVNGLLGKADVLHRQSGNRRPHCVAAATVALYNSGRGGGKLPSWWRADPEG